MKNHEPKEGIIPSQEIRELIGSGNILAEDDVGEIQVQPATIDLRLGEKAYRTRASLLPGGHPDIERKIDDLGLKTGELDLRSPCLLEKGRIYIIPLVEELALVADVSAKANPKSTSGRLDVFVRLLTDSHSGYEHVPAGYGGKLYAEVIPLSFGIVVKKGASLNQLRFLRGNPPSLTDDELAALDREETLVYSMDDAPGTARIERGLNVTINLAGSGQDVVGYRARSDAPELDINKRDHYKPDTYWEAVRYSDRGIVLEPNSLYIFISNEKVRVPPSYAAEMVNYEPAMGEFRVHYAGFYDPGFGYGSGDVSGTPAVMQIRVHKARFLIEDGQPIARLLYYPMAEPPEKVYGVGIGSSYQFQKLSLSKQFKKPK